MTSLNPVFSVGEQIAESLRLHKRLDRAAARAEALRMLELVEMRAGKFHRAADTHINRNWKNSKLRACGGDAQL